MHLCNRPYAALLAKLGVELVEGAHTPLAHGIKAFLDGDSLFIAFDQAEDILINVCEASGDRLGLNVGCVGQIDLHDGRSLLSFSIAKFDERVKSGH